MDVEFVPGVIDATVLFVVNCRRGIIFGFADKVE